jgi:hypothetical protein
MSAHEPTVGVIGLKYGRAHIPAFQASGCRVVAVCQRDPAGAKAIADRYGVPRVYGSWEQMIDEARPEIVVIATPPITHHAMALRAFAAGRRVARGSAWARDGPPDPVAVGATGANLSRLRFPSWAEEPDC